MRKQNQKAHSKAIVTFAQTLRQINSDPIEIAKMFNYKVTYIPDSEKILTARSYKYNNTNLILINKNYNEKTQKVLCARELAYFIFYEEIICCFNSFDEIYLKNEYKKNLFAVSYLLNKEDFSKLLTDIEIKDISNSVLEFVLYNLCKDIKNPTKTIRNKSIVDPFRNPISDINNIRIDVSEINDWILNELNKKPMKLYQLSPRRFEELIAEIFIRKGYDVKMTPETRDGGKDIYVAKRNDIGNFLYLVECKKYAPNHKVGVGVIRDLYGVLSKEKATLGIVATTSYFTKPAQEFQQNIQFQMSLKNFDSILNWIQDVIR